MRALISITLCANLCAIGTVATAAEPEDTNTRVVRTFFEQILGQGQVDRVTEVMAENYIQHAPNIANGVAGFREFAERVDLANQPFDVTVHRTMADGDYVWAFISMRMPNGVRAAMDLFRLEDGKLVEHWGTGQMVPPPENFIDPDTSFF